MKKQPKSAPPAKEQKPIKPAEAPQEVPSAPVVPETASPIQIPQKVLEQAASLGIDLKQIVDWAQSMEQFKAVTIANFEIIQKSFKELEPLIQLSKRVQQQTQSQATDATAPLGGSIDINKIMSVVDKFAGGGSSGIGDEITKKIIDAGLDQMFAGTELLKAMQKKLMTEMGVQTVMAAVPK